VLEEHNNVKLKRKEGKIREVHRRCTGGEKGVIKRHKAILFHSIRTGRKQKGASGPKENSKKENRNHGAIRNNPLANTLFLGSQGYHEKGSVLEKTTNHVLGRSGRGHADSKARDTYSGDGKGHLKAKTRL